jgi:magnesium chelatase family protein
MFSANVTVPPTAFVWVFCSTTNHHYCTCSVKQIQSYRNRLSGPVQDRIDILLSLRSINLEQPAKPPESFTAICYRVENARLRQFERYQTEITYAKVPFEKINQTSSVSNEQHRMLTNVAVKQNWSNRIQIKIIRLAIRLSGGKQDYGSCHIGSICLKTST